MNELLNVDWAHFVPWLMIIIVFAFIFFALMARLRYQLAAYSPFDPPRPNTRKHISFSTVTRKKGAFEWLFGPPNVLKTLANLPAELEELDISLCDEVVELKSLPPNLKRLKANGCKNLRRICALPDSLEELDLWSCEALENFPEVLPKNLKLLYAAGVKAKNLPTLPEGIEYVDMRCCEELESGPATYPASLKWLNLCRTKLMGKVSAVLPANLSLAQLNSEGYTGQKRPSRLSLMFGA